MGCYGQRIPGFKRLDLVQYGDVDYVQDAGDLSNFADGSVSEMYCSHLLEHFHHVDTVRVLKEWRRVLSNGGKAFIAVPDMAACLEFATRMPAAAWPVNLLYGDQTHPLAFHYVTFTFPMLSLKLAEAGFSDSRRIGDMPYGLDDASSKVDNMMGLPISLNVEAVA